ncbi:transposase [uncultured Phascolarctobacterium sp.]|uniref:transposase n=1 Tax=uncultured Phascolarctobacterium sp. TaxID=512296 RepID=UPI0025F639ED|nr:transposase [uncultured Phascolarctobacterium sp.]
MSGKKGMPRYSEEMKNKIIAEHKAGMSINGLSRTYGISRYSIQSWCGLRPEVELRHATPLTKGRPVKQPKTQEQVIKRLKMENELLRNFISAVGRK